MKAVIYCRVSSKDQVEGYSLDLQEEGCEQFCEQRGWDIVKVFVEEGESAKTANRKKLLELLDFCAKNKGKVDFLIVHKLDRFSRNTADHLAIKAQLAKYGVQLVSVTEPIKDDSVGRFIETVLSASSQFDNEVRGERALAGMKERFGQGAWCWVAPLGFDNASKGSTRSLLHNKKSPLILRLFEEFAKGIHTQREVTDKMTRVGLRTKTDKKPTPQYVSKILSNKVYAGINVSKRWGKEVKGDWEPIVPIELFNKVQMMRNGRAFTAVPRMRNNPDFPLRGLVLCPNCNKPLTASWARGRSKRYPYYRCYNKECKSPSLERKVLEDKFFNFLKSIQPTKAHARAFKEVVIDVWESRHKEALKLREQKEVELKKLRTLKTNLIKKNAAETLLDEDFEEALEPVKNQILVKEAELGETRIDEANLEEDLNRATNFLAGVATFWRDAFPNQKQRFQRLLFPSGIVFDGQNIETAEISPIFGIIKQSEGSKIKMAGPGGFEPPNPALEAGGLPLSLRAPVGYLVVQLFSFLATK